MPSAPLPPLASEPELARQTLSCLREAVEQPAYALEWFHKKGIPQCTMALKRTADFARFGALITVELLVITP